MTTYWCEAAWLGSLDGSVEHNVLIEVVGDRIAAIAIGHVDMPSACITLRGLTLPGMVNGHSHAFHRALRGRTHGESGSFWTWRNQMYALADRLDPDTYRALATATYAEMALAGYTTVGEFHYLHHGPVGVPYTDQNEMSNVLVEAAAAAGIRITLLDTCYLQAGFATETELNKTQRRFSDGDVHRWAERVDASSITSPTSKLGAAIHSVRAVPQDSLATVARWAATHRAPLHTHVSEQPAENTECLAATGLTPTELLYHEGVLSASFTAVHATHLSVNDVELYANTGSSCCICPTTERDLADGIGPTTAFRTARIAMTIGSDSHAIVDPFEEIRAIEMNQRLATLTRGNHQPGALLAMATSSGARSLGWSDAGILAVRALADFITVSLDSPRLAGTDLAQSVASVVFAASASDVHHVVVGGRVIVADGVHQLINVSDALTTSIHNLWA
jgi:formiminoglutamate deiminase